MHNKTLSELKTGLSNGEFSSVELIGHYVDRIKALDKNYNCFISLTEDSALMQAKQADKALASGNPPALCGLPLAHKDIFCTAGIRTTCGSRMLDNFVPPYNATVVENIAAAGMVVGVTTAS